MKYIDAEKLKSEIERRKKQDITFRERNILIDVEMAITSLQQEQPELPNNERKGIPGRDFIPVDWVEACERYGKWKIVSQEQPEADLEKEIKRYQEHYILVKEKGFSLGWMDIETTARHFYELGRLSQTK